MTAFSREGKEIGQLDELKGLATHHPAWAASLSIFLISLAGIPPSAGFFAKYYLFSQAIQVGLYPLAIVGILTSAISLYYYLAPVVRMYFEESETPISLPAMGTGVKFLVALLLLGAIYLGVLPGKVLEQTPPYGLDAHPSPYRPEIVLSPNCSQISPIRLCFSYAEEF